MPGCAPCADNYMGLKVEPREPNATVSLQQFLLPTQMGMTATDFELWS